jgi:hypothetical protein
LRWNGLAVNCRYTLPHQRRTVTRNRIAFDLIEMNRQLGFRFSVAKAQSAG